MSDDMLMHFSSNSSNQSDQSLPTKIAKLEARMAGKVSSVYPAPPVQLQQQQQKQPIWSAVSPGPRFGPPEELAESSDSDDDNGGGFLIQANTQKRRRLQENDNSAVFEHLETQTVNDGKQKIGETVETKVSTDAHRRKQGRGKGHSNSSRGRGVRANDQTRSQSSVSAALPSNGQLENSCHKEELTSLHAKVAALEDDLRKSCQEASNNHDLCHQLEKELKELKDIEQQMKPKRTKIISDLLISVSKAERQEARMKVRQDSLRLGSVGVIRAGTIISETWEDGQMLKDLNIHLRQLLETKEAVERQRKSLKKRQSVTRHWCCLCSKLLAYVSGYEKLSEAFVAFQVTAIFMICFLIGLLLAVMHAYMMGVWRKRQFCVRDRYELEKGRLIRELKRIRDEDGSRFNNFQILNHRYALLNLLGKGGFSEVYKAYDLAEHRYVACKLHGLNVQWSEDKKQSYIRHALREYNIHKTLVHNHIVRLWDIFEIDQNTFCTILEYCSGKDLDAVLKATPGMELTSQGAGTYWQVTLKYLPPECFELSKTPLISSKVDVWSAGVLFYQMLFGRRPFGHDQTQERILREDTIIKACRVEFPTKPTISNEAKDLIRQCLTYNQAERPDVLTIAQDPYLTYLKK
ncbi:hypothetical protein H0E87_008023 [Populus deltoides]|uniref:Protein kinase domain-containing protein n=1 Tax=Populus deltoides TaxID=3696 RepID=A0A8T2YZ68_POPDE|nr:hypothetical protein H0E87_008023 [Populus deltoides]